MWITVCGLMVELLAARCGILKQQAGWPAVILVSECAVALDPKGLLVDACTRAHVQVPACDSRCNDARFFKA